MARSRGDLDALDARLRAWAKHPAIKQHMKLAASDYTLDVAWDHAHEVRHTNPRAYRSPDFQQFLHDLAEARAVADVLQPDRVADNDEHRLTQFAKMAEEVYGGEDAAASDGGNDDEL